MSPDAEGPPTKIQKHSSEKEEEAEQEGILGGLGAGENSLESGSPLSMEAEVAEDEVTVILSTPNEAIPLMNNDTPPSEEAVGSDSVFMEPTQTEDEREDKQNSCLAALPANLPSIKGIKLTTPSSGKTSQDDLCPSSPLSLMEVGSPEIPMQSESPQRLHSPVSELKMETEEDKQSIAESISDSSDKDTDEEEQMMDDGDREKYDHETTDNRNTTAPIGRQPSSLLHDHSYFSQGHKEQGNNVQEDAVEVPSVAQMFGSSDHVYCSMQTLCTKRPPTLTCSVDMDRPNTGGVEKDKIEERVPNGLRSKLSSGVQDHSYCRTLTTKPASSLPEGSPVIIVHSSGDCESQDLFSADLSPLEDHMITSEVHTTGSTSYQSIADTNSTRSVTIGCQTSPQCRDVSTSTDQLNLLDTLRTCIENTLEECPSIWMVHQELLRGLSAVTEKMRDNSLHS